MSVTVLKVRQNKRNVLFLYVRKVGGGQQKS